MLFELEVILTEIHMSSSTLFAIAPINFWRVIILSFYVNEMYFGNPRITWWLGPSLEPYDEKVKFFNPDINLPYW